ncbi:hypothetical protein D1007_23364 [Hordeum vulgare]|nr:hypothetical protein D1007_23364 [Hordeum vulgare]
MRPYKFMPLPQPPGLAALSRRAASSCADAFARGGQRIEHCRNDRLIVESLRKGTFKHSVLAPLLSGEPEVVLPPIPPPGRQHNRRIPTSPFRPHRPMAAPGKWSETTMLVIDMQKDFLDTAMCSPVLVAGGEAAVPAVVEAVDVAWERGIFVVWVQQLSAAG